MIPPHPDIPPFQTDNIAQRQELDKLRYQAQIDLVKAQYTAEIDALKAEQSANLDREKLDLANHYAHLQAAYGAFLEVTKADVDRSITRATFLQGAATAVSGAYVAILALSFTVTNAAASTAAATNAANASPAPPPNLGYLPARGIVPTIFLGVAIMLAAAYVSFIRKLPDTKAAEPDGTLQGDQEDQRNNFIRWIRAKVLANQYFLHGAAVSLGVGAILLPLPYLTIDDGKVEGLAALGALLVVLTMLWSAFRASQNDAAPSVP